ncbi:hypothetical protein SCUCBS95973_008886 [Sporothrix curviconia]|uniref:Pyroglutamyl peptidase type n=1 Tax=Sporothrix curviconia TaxID=1260050 RepID=A0ABP0CQC3_9PEZI
MGSVEESPEEFTILVTGFNAFKSEYPVNPSWEIASRLPEYLPRAATGTGDSSSTKTNMPRVRIVVYPEPVRVNYQTVRKLVPTLWGPNDKNDKNSKTEPPPADTDAGRNFVPPAHIDLLLHIGMAGPRLHYALERVGRRDGYHLRDVDDELAGDTAADRADPNWVWYGVPAALESDLDLDGVLQRWRTYTAPTGNHDLRISVDAGRYLCDFIYTSSLAHLWKQGARRRVAFLHVPAAAAPERIAVGQGLVVELIRSLAETEWAARQKEKEGGGGGGGQTSTKESAAAHTPYAGADTVTGKWYRDE